MENYTQLEAENLAIEKSASNSRIGEHANLLGTWNLFHGGRGSARLKLRN
jgi:hypothetical protein